MAADPIGDYFHQDSQNFYVRDYQDRMAAEQLISEHEMAALDRQEVLYRQAAAIPGSLPQTDRGRMVNAGFGPLGGEVHNPLPYRFETLFKMVQDSTIRSSLQTIINMTIGRDWEIIGGTAEHRQFIQQMYDGLEMERVFEQVLSFIWVGFSVTEKVFNKDSDGLWRICKYKVLPPDTLKFNQEPNGELIDVIQFGFRLGFDKMVRFKPGKVNVMTYDNGLSANFANRYGETMLRGCYEDWYEKHWARKTWAHFTETVGTGYLIGNSGKKDVMTFHKMMKKMAAQQLLVARDGQSIQYVSPRSDGEVFMRKLVYHDKRIREALLAQVLQIGQEGAFGGTGALGKQQFELFNLSRITRLQQMLSTWTGRDIKQIIDINFGSQRDSKAGYPQFKFKLTTDDQQLLRAQIVSTLIKSGLLGIEYRAWANSFVEIPQIDDPGPQFVFPNRAEQPSSSIPGADDAANAPAAAAASATDVSEVEQEVDELKQQVAQLQSLLDVAMIGSTS